MKKVCLFFLLFTYTYVVSAQDRPITEEQEQEVPIDTVAVKKVDANKNTHAEISEQTDSLQQNSNLIAQDSLIPIKKKTKNKIADTLKVASEVTIADYKIISLQRDTIHFDTTLTIQKEYKYNYLRRDDFELIAFSNLGQTYNSLSLDLERIHSKPQLGARAKHFNYMEINDINYYHVPTPTTDLFFKTSMEQGQLLDALVTLNTSKQLNFSIAYKGMRSLGKYQHILSSTGNFRFTTNYLSKNKRYNLRLHFTSQDILNQENGGLAIREQFTEEVDFGGEDFRDRSRVDVKYENAQNFLLGKRYFLDHEYVFLRKNDSLKNYSLSLGHRYNYETKLYRFEQSQNNVLFGDAFQTSNLYDISRLKTMFNQGRLSYKSKITGDVTLKASAYTYNYYFNSIVVTDEGDVVKNQLRDNELAVGAEWRKKIGGFSVYADVNSNISSNFENTSINAYAKYNFTPDDLVKVSVSSISKMPNFNFLLYQSDYIPYNWQNIDGVGNEFKEEEIQSIEFEFNSKKWLNLYASYSKLNNYTYFGLYESPVEEPVVEDPLLEEPILQVRPFQESNEISYLKLKASKDFKLLWNFSFNTTVMYQQVDQQNEVLNVPEIVTRNTLYYSNHLFKKAMYLQTGITFKYFTEYYSNAYSPLLGEFYIQNQEKIGAFPMMDFFINAKVRQTRIYLKAEHFNSSFTGFDFYSSPDYPYRDFVIRFGLVWNFFS